jgi:stress response protein YsnF
MPGDERPTTRVPVVEEEVRIEKRPVQSGHVQVRTYVEERQQVLREVLFGEALEVVNVPVDREVETPPPPRQEGEVTIVSLVEERMVVTRKLFVVEELHIRRSTRLDEVNVPVTLRAMRAVVEEDNARDSNGRPSGPAPGSP